MKKCHLSNGSKINSLVEFDMVVEDQSCIACNNLPECREVWRKERRRDCRGFNSTTILFTTEEKDITSA